MKTTRRQFGTAIGAALAGTAVSGAAPPFAAESPQQPAAPATADLALTLLDAQGERGIYAEAPNLDELRTSLARKLREHRTLRAFPLSEDVQPLLQFKR